MNRWFRPNLLQLKKVKEAQEWIPIQPRVGERYGEHSARAHNRGLGAQLQQCPGAEPLLRWRGRSPPEAETFTFSMPKGWWNLAYCQAFLGSFEIGPLHKTIPNMYPDLEIELTT